MLFFKENPKIVLKYQFCLQHLKNKMVHTSWDQDAVYNQHLTGFQKPLNIQNLFWINGKRTGGLLTGDLPSLSYFISTELNSRHVPNLFDTNFCTPGNLDFINTKYWAETTNLFIPNKEILGYKQELLGS